MRITLVLALAAAVGGSLLGATAADASPSRYMHVVVYDNDEARGRDRCASEVRDNWPALCEVQPREGALRLQRWYVYEPFVR